MKRVTIATCTLILVATSASAGMKVKARSLGEADLAEYQSYTWLAVDEEASGAMIARGTYLAASLEAIGDSILGEAGLSKGAEEGPKLIFRYRGLATDMLDITGTNREISDHVTWTGDPGAHSMTSFKKGTLLVEAIDADTEELLWAGWAVDMVELFPDRLKLAKKAEKAMGKILKKFPAK